MPMCQSKRRTWLEFASFLICLLHPGPLTDSDELEKVEAKKVLRT